ncbi:hypothetical protein AB0425_18135 [Actinosynnema sp. NPDC051121]
MAYLVVLPSSPRDLASFTKNVSKQLGRPKRTYPHICIVFSPGSQGPELSHLGLVSRKGEGTSSFERRLSVHHVRAVDQPVSGRVLHTLMDKASGDRVVQAIRDYEAVLPEGTTDALLDALVRARPSSVDLVSWFRSSQSDSRLLRSARAGIWQHEREAVNLSLTIAGIDVSLSEEWNEPDEGKPFLAGVDGAEPKLARLKRRSNESHLIDHDASHFPGWRPDKVYEHHIRTFTDGNRTVEITNINADPLEGLFGVDLIYYHEQAQSMIMVQYKRLDDNRRVYADERFRSQLKRMLRVNGLSRSAVDPVGWRLGLDACFFKLAKSTPMDPYSDKLVDGLYLPASYVDKVIEARTPENQSGVTLGYHNLDRWLHNTMFLELTKEGWIGTSGVAVDEIEELASQSLDDRHAVVIAKDKTKESAKQRQQRARSRAPRRRREVDPASRR